MELALVFILGLALGSFANVLIDRLPFGRNVVSGRSACDYCHKTLRWYELIPVISFLVQGGTCRRCHRRLSIQYPLIELVSGFLAVFLFLHLSSSPTLFLSSSLLVFSLLVIFVADLKYQVIPDSMVIMGILGALIRIAALPYPLISGRPFVVSALGTSLFFLLLWAVTRGRGMGFGDVKLSFLLGLILGFSGVVIALYIAFLTGAGVGVILMLGAKKTLKTRVAFGPFLIAGTVITFIWGSQLLSLWYRFF